MLAPSPSPLSRLFSREVHRIAGLLVFSSLAILIGCGGSSNSNGGGSTTTPTIGSLSASSGVVGATVTISGANLGSSQGTGTVTFNGVVAATASAWSTTSITVTVPSGATTGNIVVTVSGQASNGSPFTVTPANTVTGTASLGAAIIGAAVTLKDANGMTTTGTTASDGTFTLNTGGMSPPFLVKAVTATASGSFPAGTTLYSVSADGNVTTHINIHVLSDLIVRSYYSANGIDADTAFASPTASGNAAPTPLAVQNLANAVIAVVQLWFNNAGLTVTPLTPPASGSINLISSTFLANNTALDSVLHIMGETVNPATGAVTALTVTGGNVAEAATPAYSSGAITVNTTTTNSGTGVTSSESISGLLLSTTPQLSAILGINAQLTALQAAINKNSSTLTGSVLLPYFASDYLNDSDSASVDAVGFASELTGATLTGLQVGTVKSINTTTNIADVITVSTITQGGVTAPNQTQEFLFKEESGSWLIYGDQRVAQVSITAQNRTSQGSPSLGNNSNGAYMFAEVEAPSGAVTNATVSGGGNIWPNCTVPTSCAFTGAVSTTTLQEQAMVVQNGQNYGDFLLLSDYLGGNPQVLPAAGTQFTFNLTSTSGNKQYTLPSTAFTTEVISISNAPTSGPLTLIVGQTVTYKWSLPTTYAIAQVNLFAYILNGAPTNPATTSCSISSSSSLTMTSTSGTITIPANMSPCGVSGSIAEVQVFLEVTGANGENNIVELTYPF
jgi:hypothetical protein